MGWAVTMPVQSVAVLGHPGRHRGGAQVWESGCAPASRPTFPGAGTGSWVQRHEKLAVVAGRALPRRNTDPAHLCLGPAVAAGSPPPGEPWAWGSRKQAAERTCCCEPATVLNRMNQN